MSYTFKLKEEIMNRKITNEDEIYAELFGIFLSKNCFNNYGVSFSTENSLLAERVEKNLKKITNLEINFKYTISKRFFKSKIYTITINNEYEKEEEYSKFFKKMYSLKKYHESDIKILENIVRGYFLSSGYVKDPHKGYTLDFFIDSEDAATFLYMILKHLNKKVFQTEKKNKNIVYIRNSEDILDILNSMSAINMFFEYQDIIISKELNNKINRNMNYEIANETKKISTGLKQIEMIEFIDSKIGIDSLTSALSEIAKLRLENESASFQELAVKSNISKSGIRNRFKRLEEIYLELKGKI